MQDAGWRGVRGSTRGEWPARRAGYRQDCVYVVNGTWLPYTYATRRRGKEEALYVAHEGSLIPPSLVPPFPSLSLLSFASDVRPAFALPPRSMTSPSTIHYTNTSILSRTTPCAERKDNVRGYLGTDITCVPAPPLHVPSVPFFTIPIPVPILIPIPFLTAVYAHERRRVLRGNAEPNSFAPRRGHGRHALYVDAFEDALWIRMELMTRTLASVIALGNAGLVLPDRVIAGCVKDILAALEVLRENGLRPGNISSQNVLLNSDGVLKLTNLSAA
ncbi:hypothetical protein C8F04DRAFT_1387844 [Mycena alexandri]|uniref:Uncharacterized protein n=1 Tax=Mycena alexandri TaxID=1745969 RepID=A0AAD6XFF4_9AGAR|nr:hypothetical protein C8F04DRAFT_1387836 [Mycena alexandri]KAJ7046251.1 hypothetical protein C8F04DRAFT_1387844 [Mycena alexandri]